MQEIWKDIIGYEGLYKVSSLGRIKSLSRKDGFYNMPEKILKQSTSNHYPSIGLNKNGKLKTRLVHRIVAETFISNPLNLPQVNHKDENKENNCVDNLEWCTAKYNVNYGTCISRRAKTQRDTKCQINNKGSSRKVKCIENGIIYPSIREAERILHLDGSSISKVCRGKNKHTKGYTFVYV